MDTKNSKLWGGRFGVQTSAILDEFNTSLPFDKLLYKEDIQGSIAHTKMLEKCGILNPHEAREIKEGLKQIKTEIDTGKFAFKDSDEDIHMAVESRLIELIGENGKKLHTARSRNDQVAIDFRLFVLRKNCNIAQLLVELNQTLLNLANQHTHTLIPGMTHLQHAQVVNFGFLCCAYVCMFMRDIQRLESSYERSNLCPLGVAALAGVPYPNDRFFLAQKLGFTSPTINATDTVSDRDFALDFLYDCSMIAMHISRLAEELILWSSAEFGFITFSDSYSTGSSIMPQKKNPDVAELLRGKSGRVFGNLMGLLVVLKGLPLAYNKDTQEDKESVFDSTKTLEISLKILNELIKTMTVNKNNMLKACQKGHLTATDLADYLAQHCNIPFREAHHIVGRIVSYAEKRGVDISMLSQEELVSQDVRIPKDAYNSLDPMHSMESKDSFGGTSSRRTKEQIELLGVQLQQHREKLELTQQQRDF